MTIEAGIIANSFPKVSYYTHTIMLPEAYSNYSGLYFMS